MSTYSPSYLYKNRYGIFHFRCRIPISIRKEYKLTKVEIRKSLGTGNRTEALRLSRILWVEMEKTDYNMRDVEFEMEQQQIEDAEGKKLLKKFLIAQIISGETGILEDEDIDTYFSDDYWGETEAQIVFRNINTRQEELLNKQLDFFSGLPLKKQKKILLKLKAEIEQVGKKKDLVDNSKATGTDNISQDELIIAVQQANKKKLTVIELKEAFDRYITYGKRIYNWKDIDKQTVNISIFMDIVDVENCCDLSIEHIIEYRDVLVNLPKRYDIDKDCIGLSYVEMSKLPNKKHVHPNTLINKIGVVKNFLRWCEDINYIDVDFEKVFKSIKKTKRGKKNRVPYNPDELERLFNSKQYIQGTHKTPARHWLLLIALFTGARLNEICQLHKSNIVKDSQSGIWYFDFNDYAEDRGKKSDAMIRFVPVHTQLRKLGFFKYYDSVDDESRLFPMLKLRDRSYGTAITKFFRTYKNKNNCKIEIPDGVMKDFHSFRNTIINSMKQAGINQESAREVVGHENPGLAYGGYADPLDLPNKKKIIEKVKYPSIDWDLVKEREWRPISYSK